MEQARKDALRAFLKDLSPEELRFVIASAGGRLGKRTLSAEERAYMRACKGKKTK